MMMDANTERLKAALCSLVADLQIDEKQLSGLVQPTDLDKVLEEHTAITGTIYSTRTSQKKMEHEHGRLMWVRDGRLGCVLKKVKKTCQYGAKYYKYTTPAGEFTPTGRPRKQTQSTKKKDCSACLIIKELSVVEHIQIQRHAYTSKYAFMQAQKMAMQSVKEGAMCRTMYQIYLPLQSTHSGHECSEPTQANLNPNLKINILMRPTKSDSPTLLESPGYSGDIKVGVDPDTMEVVYSFEDRMVDETNYEVWVESADHDYVADQTKLDEPTNYDEVDMPELEESDATNDSMMALPIDNPVNIRTDAEDAHQGLIKAISFLQSEASDASLHILSLWAVLKFIEELPSFKYGEKLNLRGSHLSQNQLPCSSTVGEPPAQFTEIDEPKAPGRDDASVLNEDYNDRTVCVVVSSEQCESHPMECSDWEVVERFDDVDEETYANEDTEDITSHLATNSSGDILNSAKTPGGSVPSEASNSTDHTVDAWNSVATEKIDEGIRCRGDVCGEDHSTSINISWSGTQVENECTKDSTMTVLLLPSIVPAGTVTRESIKDKESTITCEDESNSSTLPVEKSTDLINLSDKMISNVRTESVSASSDESSSLNVVVNHPMVAEYTPHNSVSKTKPFTYEYTPGLLPKGFHEGITVSQPESDVEVYSSFVIESPSEYSVAENYNTGFSNKSVSVEASRERTGNRNKGSKFCTMMVKDMLSCIPSAMTKCCKCDKVFSESRFLAKHMRNHHIRHGLKKPTDTSKTVSEKSHFPKAPSTLVSSVQSTPKLLEYASVRLKPPSENMITGQPRYIMEEIKRSVCGVPDVTVAKCVAKPTSEYRVKPCGRQIEDKGVGFDSFASGVNNTNVRNTKPDVKRQSSKERKPSDEHKGTTVREMIEQRKVRNTYGTREHGKTTSVERILFKADDVVNVEIPFIQSGEDSLQCGSECSNSTSKQTDTDMSSREFAERGSHRKRTLPCDIEWIPCKHV